MNDTPERMVMAKTLTDLFAERGVKIHYAYARALITACPASMRGRYVRFSDAWRWWGRHPDFQPFAEKRPKIRADSR